MATPQDRNAKQETTPELSKESGEPAWQDTDIENTLLVVERTQLLRAQQESVPGAWRQTGNVILNDSAEGNEERFLISPQGTGPMPNDGPDQENQSLVVANLVEDNVNTLPIALPDVDNTDILDSARTNDTKQCKTYVLLTVLLLIAILAIVVTLMVPTPNISASKTTDDESPTGSPSNAPTTEEDYLLALFPEDIVDAILAPDSPQARAYQWLLADEIDLPGLSDERIKQRFALATLYFATSVVIGGW